VQHTVTLGNGRVPSGAARLEQNGGRDDRGGAASGKTVTETIRTVTTDGLVKSETIIY
ncbi:Hypp9701, partial [Branchiostoma lanceolatum]